jgi:hypothetical protein
VANPSAISTATTATPPPPTSGGVALVRGHLLAGQTYAVNGTIFPAAPGTTITVQLQTGHHWKTVGSGVQDTDGSYSIAVPAAGIYRVLYNGIVGPSVKVR